MKSEQLIDTELLGKLHQDPARIPVVSVEAIAPESGSFNWRDHYKRLLHQLDEPLIDHKLNREAGPVMRFMPPSRAAGTCLLYTSPSPRDRTRSRMPSSA